MALTEVKSSPEPVRDAADRVNLIGNLLRAPGRGALIEQVRDEQRHAALLVRIVRAAGPHEQAHRHRRLLVMQHGDDLHPVGQRADVMRREGDLLRRQRPRHAFDWPGWILREKAWGIHNRIPNPKTQETPLTTCASPRSSFLREHVEDNAVGVVEVGLRDPLDVRGGHVHEDFELAVSRADVVVDDGGMGEVHRLLLNRFAAEDVVARPLVLRPLQLVGADRLALQLLELLDQRFLRFRGRPSGCSTATA